VKDRLLDDVPTVGSTQHPDNIMQAACMVNLAQSPLVTGLGRTEPCPQGGLGWLSPQRAPTSIPLHGWPLGSAQPNSTASCRPRTI